MNCMRPIPKSSQNEGEAETERGSRDESATARSRRHPRMISKTQGKEELEDDEIWIMVHEF